MSQENAEIVVGVFENTNARDFEAVMDAYADDVVLRFHGGSAGVGGDGAVGKRRRSGEWFGDWFRTFDSDYRFEMEETRNWGDRVLVVVTHNTRGRASGVPVTLRGAWIFRLLGGKIVRFDAYADRAEALQAAGLRE